MSENKYIALALKLKELAEKGVGGEKTNAQEKLRLIMQKYNISETDITGGVRCRFDIHIPKDMPFRFFSQILSSVVGKVSQYGCNVYEKKYVQKRGHVTFSIENIEPHYFAEFDAKLNVYWRHFKEESELFYSAFVQKNALYQKPSENENDTKHEEISHEERVRLWKLANMMEGMEKLKVNKELNP
jgi:hypothetical protein